MIGSLALVQISIAFSCQVYRTGLPVLVSCGTVSPERSILAPPPTLHLILYRYLYLSNGYNLVSGWSMELGASIRLSHLLLVSFRTAYLPSISILGYRGVPILHHLQIYKTPCIALFWSFNRLLNLLSSYYKLIIQLLASLFCLDGFIFLLLFFGLFAQLIFLDLCPHSLLFLNFLSSFHLFNFLTSLFGLFLLLFSWYIRIFLSLLVAGMLHLIRGPKYRTTILFNRYIK